jgi:4'-phosphopantetheinyl transferase
VENLRLDICLVDFKKFNNVEELEVVLSEAERRRAGRFLRESDAQSYIISHAQLRRALATRLGCGPQDVKIETSKHGKPFLSGAQNLHFNLSHAGDYALIALSSAAPVGVDIEKINPKSDYLAIAQRFFAQDECSYIECNESRIDAFFKIWTLKEAYVKAIGRGLAYGMDKFSVISPEQQVVSKVDGYQLQSVDVPKGYYGAVAFKLNM